MCCAIVTDSLKYENLPNTSTLSQLSTTEQGKHIQTTFVKLWVLSIKWGELSLINVTSDNSPQYRALVSIFSLGPGPMQGGGGLKFA
jgi:hypothetical protein